LEGHYSLAAIALSMASCMRASASAAATRSLAA